MKHSALNKGLMLDWLKLCDEHGEPFPDDGAICDRFGFRDVELARTLLADLADAGKIFLKGAGASRVISLAPPPKLKRATPRPIPSVTKPETDVDRCVGKIIEIVRRGQLRAKITATKASPVHSPPLRIVQPPPAQAVEPPAAVAPKPLPKPSQAPRVAAPAPAPSAPPVEPTSQLATVARPVRGRPPVAAPASKRRQVNIRLDPDLERVFLAAAKPGEVAAVTALRLVQERLAEKPAAPVPPKVKPLIRADVLRACNEAGADLHLFVNHLIDLGLGVWRAEKERAA